MHNALTSPNDDIQEFYDDNSERPDTTYERQSDMRI